jgi:hypothetical protein
MVAHSYVPSEFGKGIIVPLVKNKTGDLSSLSNYRAITLIPVISKLFESVLLRVTGDFLTTEETQFGFKKGVGCSNAIFAMRTTVDYYVARGSTVFTAALDISKAYDCVNHYKLFTSLLKAGVPRWLVDVLVNWYGKLFVAVRWNECMSSYFKVGSGVRQGSPLSPALFNVFVNVFILNTKESGQGCYMNRVWLGCIMYADDIILLSASIRGLQTLLTCCFNTSKELSLKFNCDKSCCIAFGPRAKLNLPHLVLGDGILQWCTSIKYLGISFLSGMKLKCDIDVITRKFYAASNNIFSNTRGSTELMQLHLQQAYCLPILQYATSAVKLTEAQLGTLNVCWNNVYRKIFGFNKWESVKQFICGLGNLDYVFLRYLSMVLLFKSMYESNNNTVKMLMHMFSLTDEFEAVCTKLNMNVIKFTQLSKFKLRVHMFDLFLNYASL